MKLQRLINGKLTASNGFELLEIEKGDLRNKTQLLALLETNEIAANKSSDFAVLHRFDQ